MTTEEHILVHVYDVMPLGVIRLSEGDKKKFSSWGKDLTLAVKTKMMESSK